MNPKIKHISIIGDGAWGTTLAVYLNRKGFSVSLWGPFPDYVKQVSKSRINTKFLPGIKIPHSVILTADLAQTLNVGELIVLAIPSQYMKDVLKKAKNTKISLSKKLFLSVTKGVDTKSLLRVSQIVRRELGPVHFAALSGPTIAMEVAQGIPTTAVVACKNLTMAKTIQAIFNSKNFRIYTNTDVIGVELGGSIKNIIAIACGVCDGINFGTNAKAAIVTRGLSEMARLGSRLGAKVETFFGLSGLGDLATTCFSPQSRNRHVGEQLGRGQSIKQIISSMNHVAEGVETAKAVYKLSVKLKVPMPITKEVYNIIYKNKKPSAAVADLMARQAKNE